VAFSTHARVGIAGVRVGLPEVLLGILPGAGGTQRAPRLIGVDAAMEMITSGRHIPTAEAKELGLIDSIESGDPRDVAIASAEAVTNGTLATRRTCDVKVEVSDEIVASWKAKIEAKFPNLFSPHRCVEAVAASALPIDEGLKEERRLFMQCMDSPQRSGLIHAFFSERAVQKVPEAKETPRDIAAMAVIGGGTMGSGITTSALMAGLSVKLMERNDEAVEHARKTITGNLDGGVKRGKMKQEVRDDILNNKLTFTTDIAALDEADLIIEAVFEEMPIKKDIFTQLDKIAKPGAILASNTSYLDVNEIASATSRPQDVLGLHFFSPAHIMRLLEVIAAEKTAPEVTATGFALAKKLKKVGVRSEVCDGFIGNRILAHYRRVVDYMYMDGADFEHVDKALEAFGFAMGPFAVSDLAGLDIGWATRKRLAKTRSNRERVVDISDRICENGWFGRKTGKGFYVYDGKNRSVNPEIKAIEDSERAAAGVTPRNFTDEEIVDRYMTAMISEAARVVDDGTALRPIDVDAVFLFGYGFPRFRGGPLHYADTIGAQTLIDRIETYAKEDDYYWQVPDILRRMANDGSTFGDLN